MDFDESLVYIFYLQRLLLGPQESKKTSFLKISLSCTHHKHQSFVGVALSKQSLSFILRLKYRNTNLVFQKYLQKTS